MGKKPVSLQGTQGLATNIVERKIMGDNVFTDFSLAEKLLMNWFTYARTVKTNEEIFPSQALCIKKGDTHSWYFGFDKLMSLK